jgi:hypothetical protein
MRNGVMLTLEPNLTIAFHNNLRESRGTRNCILRSLDKGIRTVLITSNTRRK